MVAWCLFGSDYKPTQLVLACVTGLVPGWDQSRDDLQVAARWQLDPLVGSCGSVAPRLVVFARTVLRLDALGVLALCTNIRSAWGLKVASPRSLGKLADAPQRPPPEETNAVASLESSQQLPRRLMRGRFLFQSRLVLILALFMLRPPLGEEEAFPLGRPRLANWASHLPRKLPRVSWQSFVAGLR